MKSKFLYGKVTKKQRDFIESVLDIGFDFLDGSIRNNKVVNYLPLNQLKTLFNEPIPKEGEDFEKLLDCIKTISKYSIAQCDQRFLAFPDSGNSIASLAGEIIRAFLNQNLIAVDRSAPIATLIEIQLILWLRELIGYPSCSIENISCLNEIGGMWTTGGNMSNYIAVLTALRHRFPEVKESGLISLKKRPVIVLSKGIEHYSFAGALQALGLGEKGAIWAETTGRDYTSNIKSIENAIINRPPDVEPFLVVAVAGNCRTSSIDDMWKFRELCDKYGLWLHVDACHGGSLLFSEKLRKAINGIEMSDSVSLDPHKSLFTTYSSSYVLFKNPSSLSNYCRYPDKVFDTNCLDLGLITPFFGSRGFESIKLWLLIKNLGKSGLEKVIESREETYYLLVKMLEKTNLFKFLNTPQLYRIAFVFYPKSVREYINICFKNDNTIPIIRKLINDYTSEFCETLYRSGKVVFDLFALQDLGNRIGFGIEKYQVMGMSVGHPFISKSNLKEIKNEITKMGRFFEKKMLGDLKNLKIFNGRIEAEIKTVSPASW